jgi:type IV fimbrial biogenesis protein FimT
VYHDVNNNNALDAGEPIIRYEQPASAGYRILSATESVLFLPSGVGATQATLKVCRAAPSVGSQEREVIISATGRTSVTSTTTATCS